MAERSKVLAKSFGVHFARRFKSCSFLKKRTVVERAETGFATGGEAYHKRPWITFEIVMHRRL